MARPRASLQTQLSPKSWRKPQKRQVRHGAFGTACAGSFAAAGDHRRTLPPQATPPNGPRSEPTSVGIAHAGPRGQFLVAAPSRVHTPAFAASGVAHSYSGSGPPLGAVW